MKPEEAIQAAHETVIENRTKIRRLVKVLAEATRRDVERLEAAGENVIPETVGGDYVGTVLQIEGLRNETLGAAGTLRSIVSDLAEPDPEGDDVVTVAKGRTRFVLDLPYGRVRIGDVVTRGEKLVAEANQFGRGGLGLTLYKGPKAGTRMIVLEEADLLNFRNWFAFHAGQDELFQDDGPALPMNSWLRILKTSAELYAEAFFGDLEDLGFADIKVKSTTTDQGFRFRICTHEEARALLEVVDLCKDIKKRRTK